MLGVLIWAVVIICIIVKVKNGGNTTKTTRNRSYQTYQTTTHKQPVNYGAPTRQSQPVNYGALTQQSQPLNYGAPVSQSELKQRLQQKYGTQGAAQPAKKLTQPVQRAAQLTSENTQAERQQNMDILHRATENVAEFDCIDVLEETDFMNQVNDLMIMGYSGKLSYERDFVAEGIAMLNQFNMPQGELPESSLEVPGL